MPLGAPQGRREGITAYTSVIPPPAPVRYASPPVLLSALPTPPAKTVLTSAPSW